MRTRLLSVLLLTLCMSGCIARNRVNDNCQWTGDARTRLDIHQSADIRHLMHDATVAEDVAIRYADATRGRGSGHFAGWDEYESTRERCMASLFIAAADAHGVEAKQVRDLLARRPLAVDVPVVLAFGVLFLALSNAIIGGVLTRFSIEPPTPAIVASLVIAPAVSACGLLVLGMWAGVVEMIRLGNIHISYRGDRLPWSHHSLTLFAAGVVVFLSTAALRGYRDRTARRATGVEEASTSPFPNAPNRLDNGPVLLMAVTTIIALGDSTTAGTPGFRSPIEAPPNGDGNVTSQYAYWLMQTHRDWQVLNRGVNGERSDQIRARFARDVRDAHPAVAIVIAGVNDVYQGRAADVVQRELEAIYDAARAARIVVVAGTIVPYNTATADQNARMHAVNDWIRDYASRHDDVVFCDTRAAVAAPGQPDRLASSPDDLHPSPDGYSRMADALEPAVKLALTKAQSLR